MHWKESFREGEELVLATSSRSGKPNANVVVSLGFFDGKLLIADCQMKTTRNNLEENKKVVVIGGYFRMRGNAEVFNSGKYLKISSEKSKGFKVAKAILISPGKVEDLNNQTTVKL
jgi:hypothetical protein